MNVLEKVAQTRPDIEGAEENISAARQRLLREIHGAPQTVKAGRARRPLLIAGGVVGAAAAVTAGVLVVNAFAVPTGRVEAVPTQIPRPTTAPSSTPQPTVEPVTVASAFSAAGTAAASFTGLTLAPGQYLRIEATTHDVVFYEPINGAREYLVDRSNATSAWEMVTTDETYVPADPHGEWRYFGTSVGVGALYGPEAQQKSQEGLAGGPTPGSVGMPGGPLAPWSPEGENYHLVDFLESMPKDPAQLIAWADEQLVSSFHPAGTKAGWLLIDVLAENVGSAETRAAMYAALSMLDGFELVSVVGDVVTVALATPTEDQSGNPTTVRRTAVIDTSTGLVKEKTMTIGSGSSVVPDPVPDFRVTYSVAVVDTLP